MTHSWLYSSLYQVHIENMVSHVIDETFYNFKAQSRSSK